MLQAALSDCQFLDFLPFSQDSFIVPKIDVGWGDVFHEGADLAFKITRQVVIFQ
jgi:hypothetical protein